MVLKQQHRKRVGKKKKKGKEGKGLGEHREGRTHVHLPCMITHLERERERERKKEGSKQRRRSGFLVWVFLAVACLACLANPLPFLFWLILLLHLLSAFLLDIPAHAADALAAICLRDREGGKAKVRKENLGETRKENSKIRTTKRKGKMRS